MLSDCIPAEAMSVAGVRPRSTSSTGRQQSCQLEPHESVGRRRDDPRPAQDGKTTESGTWQKSVADKSPGHTVASKAGNHGCEVSEAEELHRVSALPDEGIVSLFTALKASREYKRRLFSSCRACTPLDAWTPTSQRVHICPGQDVKLLSWHSRCFSDGPDIGQNAAAGEEAPRKAVVLFRFGLVPEPGILTRFGPLKLMVRCGDGSTPQAHGVQRLRARHRER